LVINLAVWLSNGLITVLAFWPQVFGQFVPAGAENAIFPGNVLLTTYNAFKINVDCHLTSAQRTFHFGAVAESPAQPLRVILVIGESSTAERWQLGGYGRPTNPLLTQVPQDQLIYFPDILSVGTTTCSTVPVILTRATPAQFDIAARERSIVSVFAESGYATAWISNQDRFPYSEEADSEVYANPKWSLAANGRYDEDLVPFVERQILAHRRLFMVIHTMGSHIDYRSRVPESERFFAKRPGAGFLDEYDDTIRYTDKFLASLISMLTKIDDVPSVLLYVSDHGQDLAHAARGDLSQGLSVYDSALIHVPMFIWMSPHYVRNWPDVATKLTQNRLVPHSQIEVFRSLVTLGFIKCPGQGPSLFAPHWHRKRPVLFGTKIQEYP
jgi:glucan phosphoethanolaminetransferase (alkaline phosphatase superfamily)